MNDITVRRCTVRFVRRGGWSWGADPQQWMDIALRRLPALLQATAAEIGDAAEADVQIDCPVVVHVPLGKHLAAALARPADAQAPSGAVAAVELEIRRQIVSQLRPALPEAGEMRAGSSGVPSSEPAPEVPQVAMTGTLAEQRGSSLIAFLSRLISEGRAQSVLAAGSPATLLQIFEGLLESWPMVREPVGELTAETMAACVSRAREAGRWVDSVERREPIVRIVLGVELARARVLTRAEALRILDEHVPLTERAPRDAAAVSPQSASFAPQSVGSATASRVDAAARISPRRQTTDFEVDLPCALPFMMLGRLAPTGYLDAAAAALEAAHGQHLMAAFARALARKALPPPKRGWLRSPSDELCAAIAAGLSDVPEDDDTAQLLHVLDAHAAMLDAVLAESVAAGHRPAAAWLLCALPGGTRDEVAVFDADGALPLAWGAGQLLVARLAASGSPVMLERACAGDELLEALLQLEIPFLTNRDLRERSELEAVRTRSGERFWITKRGAHQGAMRGLAEDATDAWARSASSWSAFAIDRPSFGPGASASLERSLALAAGVALGEMAWVLWHEQGSVLPSLAFDWLGDLSGRVRGRPDEIHVRLPLGKRYRHLRESGLLDDVSGVPWFGGRVLRFSAG